MLIWSLTAPSLSIFCWRWYFRKQWPILSGLEGFLNLIFLLIVIWWAVDTFFCFIYRLFFPKAKPFFCLLVLKFVLELTFWNIIEGFWSNNMHAIALVCKLIRYPFSFWYLCDLEPQYTDLRLGWMRDINWHTSWLW